MIRSIGGWSAVKALRKAQMFYKSDERILGDSDFVDEVLSAADEQLKSKYALKAAGVDLNSLVVVVARLMYIELAEFFRLGRDAVRLRPGAYYIVGR